ncbi:hypothetical protein ACIBH1_45395 [Nonomuraea sp. NPDC050663]|uniref:hypothetical protein n=1 Tax=Nonomuraea sp. NPDC050663 TaxID=3364370 RepID=UPI0037A1D5E1
MSKSLRLLGELDSGLVLLAGLVFFQISQVADSFVDPETPFAWNALFVGVLAFGWLLTLLTLNAERKEHPDA